MQPDYRDFLKSYFPPHPEDKDGGSGSDSGGSETGEDRADHPLPHHAGYPGHSGLRVLPSGALISSSGPVHPGSMDTMPLSMSSSTSIGGGLVQYTTNPDTAGPYFVPSGMSSIGPSEQGSPGDESTRSVQKREIRLLKNREAARECRRKKKEYIKCLENRVAVLENQNKALIEELKSLRELYTGGKMM